MRLLYRFIIIFFVTLSTHVFSQTFEWAKQVGNGTVDLGSGIATDLNGNVYTCGRFIDSVDFDPGPGTEILVGHGFMDIFLMKVDSMGNFIWARSFGSAEATNDVRAIYIDNNNNIYLTGIVGPLTDLDPGIDTLITSPYISPVFTSKFDSDGNLIWAKMVASGSTTSSMGLDLLVDESGNVYTLGEFSGTTDFDPDSLQTHNVYAGNSNNLFISKLDSTGAFLDVINTSGNGGANVDPVSLEMDIHKSLFVNGTFNGTIDFDPDTSVNNQVGNQSSFILKLDSLGGLDWIGVINNTTGVQGVSGMKIDASANIYVTGYFTGSVDFDPGIESHYITSTNASLYLLKLNNSGAFEWVHGLTNGYPLENFGLELSGNQLYVVGKTGGSMDFDPGIGLAVTGINNQENNFIAKYDLNGGFTSITNVSNSAGSLKVRGFSINSNKDILLTGFFYETFNFNPAGNNILVSNTSGDIFIWKFEQDICSDIGLHIDSAYNGSCLNPGIAYTSVLGAAEPLVYSWNTSPPVLNSTGVFDSSGIFTLSITDSNQCIKTTSLYIDAPSLSSTFDLNANLVSGSLRSGLGASLWVDYFNNGCLLVSGNTKLVLDSSITFDYAIPSPTQVSGDTLTWEFDSVNYDSLHYIPQVFITLSPLLLPGDSVNFDLIISPVINDIDSSNNEKHYRLPVVNGYDPNIKNVYPDGLCNRGLVSNDQLLTYTIQFQNTGNAEAINIYLIDSLSSDLNISSLQVIGYSHPVITEILPGNIIKFRFDNIMLVDSTTNEPESHGHVVFQVKPASTVNEAAVIENKAAIYFDYNLPVITNTVVNIITYQDPGTIICNLGISSNTDEQVYIFPNPTYDVLQVVSTYEVEYVEIINLNGQVVKNIPGVNGPVSTIMVDNLIPGVYVVRLTGPDTIYTSKFIKQ